MELRASMRGHTGALACEGTQARRQRPRLASPSVGTWRGRQWVRGRGRALLLLNARTTLGLNRQGPGCRSPRGLAIRPLWATGF